MALYYRYLLLAGVVVAASLVWLFPRQVWRIRAAILRELIMNRWILKLPAMLFWPLLLGTIGLLVALKDPQLTFESLSLRSGKFWVVPLLLLGIGTITSLWLWFRVPWPGGVALGPLGIRRLLTQMGYSIEQGILSDGEETCIVKIDRIELRCDVCVNLSSDHSQIWLAVFLADVPETMIHPAEVLRILQANTLTAPVFFAVFGSRLNLMRAVENVEVTPERFRTAFEQFLYWIGATEDKWSSFCHTIQHDPSGSLPEELRHAIKPTDRRV